MFDPRGVLRLILTTAHGDRQIGRLRACSSTTVGRYRRLAHENGLTLEALEAMTDSDLARTFNPGRVFPKPSVAQPDWTQVALKAKEGHHLNELHEVYVAEAGQAPVMSYRGFLRGYRRHVAAAHPIMRQRHRPGEAMMVDFAGYRPIGRQSGGDGVTVFELFVAVMPASDYTFACVTRSQRIADWTWANEQALRFFGGAPLTIVSDNLKAAILSHPRGKPPVINPAFQAFCDHHGTVARPAQVHSPTHKAKVEIGVKLVQRLLRLALRDRPLASLDEMNDLLRGIIARLNNRPLRRAPGETRKTLFEALDRSALRALPAERFEIFEVRRQLLVGPDYHLMHDHCHYSVPHRLIGRRMDLRAGPSAIEIWCDNRMIAVHPRLEVAGETSTDPDHMPPHHLARRASEDENLVLWARLHGPAVQEVARHEADRRLSGAAKSGVFRSFRTLARLVGRDRLEAACARAIRSGDPRLHHVRNVLDRGLEFSDPAAFVPPNTAAATNENVRGPDYFAGE
jgi:transposase